MTRKRNLTDVVLTERELRLLKKGKHVYKHLNGQVFNIYLSTEVSKTLKKIKKLRAMIRELKQQNQKPVAV